MNGLGIVLFVFTFLVGFDLIMKVIVYWRKEIILSVFFLVIMSIAYAIGFLILGFLIKNTIGNEALVNSLKLVAFSGFTTIMIFIIYALMSFILSIIFEFFFIFLSFII